MKRMKTIGKVLIVLIILFSISTSGCIRKYPQDMVIMFTQVFHAVPGGGSYDMHVIEGETIETDKYGRMLFSFSTGSYVWGNCIMQKHDEKNVYYYDNVSYLIKEQYRNQTTEELDAFYKANDWNEPMDEGKMIKRELIKSTLSPNRESAMDLEVAKRAFYETIDENDYMTGTAYFDYSQTGQEIFLMSRNEQINTEDNSDLKLIDYHLMILNADGSYDPENYLIKIDNLSQSNAALAEIKERNGWEG